MRIHGNYEFNGSPVPCSTVVCRSGNIGLMAKPVIPFLVLPFLFLIAPTTLSQDLERVVDSHETRLTDLERDFRENESTDVGLENRLTTIETYQRVTLAVIGAIGLAVLSQIVAGLAYIIWRAASASGQPSKQ